MNQLDLFDRKATEYNKEELFENMNDFDWAKGSPESLAYFFADTLKNLDSIILKRWQDRKNVDHCKCHNYQPACEHKDCNTCEDWWYDEAEHGRFAEKGR